MKFVSKNSNLGIVLKPGFQGNAQLGTTTVAGIYARFKDGVLVTDDEWMVEKLLSHPGYKVDYFDVEDGNRDPYEGKRVQAEPTHIMSDMKNGHPERTSKTPVVSMTPEIKAALYEMAKEMAKPMALELSKQMLPDMVTEVIRSMQGSQPEESPQTEDPVAKKAGRPKKVVTE